MAKISELRQAPSVAHKTDDPQELFTALVNGLAEIQYNALEIGRILVRFLDEGLYENIGRGYETFDAMIADPDLPFPGRSSCYNFMRIARAVDAGVLETDEVLRMGTTKTECVLSGLTTLARDQGLQPADAKDMTPLKTLVAEPEADVPEDVRERAEQILEAKSLSLSDARQHVQRAVNPQIEANPFQEYLDRMDSALARMRGAIKRGDHESAHRHFETIAATYQELTDNWDWVRFEVRVQGQGTTTFEAATRERTCDGCGNPFIASSFESEEAFCLQCRVKGMDQ